MKTNHVRAKLKRGEPSIGTWLVLPEPGAAQLMGRVGFDWLTVDMEHGPIDLSVAARSFALIAAGGCAPLVRVPWNTGENIKRVLDCGAWGVVVPMVNSREEAELVVRSARFMPVGDRSVGGSLHAASFDTDPATYYERANDEILVIVMLEHVKGIEKADEILSVPGIDGCFIGPNDLHKSMNKKPAFDSDDRQFVEAVHHVRVTAKKHGVASGIHVVDAAAAQRRVAEGFQFVAITSEAGMMLAKAREIAQTLGLGRGREGAKY
jgi:4-hydroxy-2-oxoheptanedioate aldolase